MGHKDIISRTLLKKLVRDFAYYLFNIPIVSVELLGSDFQRVEERRSDLLAIVQLQDGLRAILHIEIQNDNCPTMPVRMLRYLTDILLDHQAQSDLPVLQYVVYIGRDKLNMSDRVERGNLSFQYRLLDMHSIDYTLLINREEPDAWVMAILCDFKGRNPQDIIHGVLTRLIEYCDGNQKQLHDYIKMMEVLGNNRDLNINIQEELEMLSVNIEELPTYRIGMKQGKEEGREIGMGQGRTDLLQRQLIRKFGTLLTADHLIRIQSADEATQLRWADQILFANSVDEALR